MAKLSILCLSDTHLRNKFVAPEVDVILHAGDHTLGGRIQEITQAAMNLGSRPAKKRIAIAGNHDWLFQKDTGLARKLFEERGIIYLQDQQYVIQKATFPQLDKDLVVYGSPWQPEFYDWAFNLKRGAQIKEKWDMIPDGIDILMTHGPPYGIQDKAPRGYNIDNYGEADFAFSYEMVGCKDLLDAINRIKPGLHVFGHIHRDKGWKKWEQTLCVNAAICSEEYKDEHGPIVVEYENGSFEVREVNPV